MITLTQLINATAWLEPEKHMRISLWDKTKVYEEDEFKDIPLNVRALARYGDYLVDDIDVEGYKDQVVLSCTIWKGENA